MNTENSHLLTKHGVLSNFHIVKKIKTSFINSLKRKYKKQGKTTKQIKQLINEDIISHTEKFLNENNIPGLIYEDHHEEQDIPYLDTKTRNKIIKLLEYCENFSNKNKFEKDHVILFVQLFLHKLNIKNSDISEFKKKYGIDDPDNSDSGENDDEDYI